jgi:preprotein translocase subunit SecE
MSDRGTVTSSMQWNPVVWFTQSRQFLMEVRTEFRKVTWPSQKEAVAGTVGVLVIVAVITAVLSTIDLVLGQLMQWILP